MLADDGILSIAALEEIALARSSWPSGKGGVGKTTSTAALGARAGRAASRGRLRRGPAQSRPGARRRASRGLRLINVVQGVARLSQALIRDKRLEICGCCRPRRPATRTRSPSKASPASRAARQVRLGDLRQPGRHRARATLAMRFADAVIVTNPEVSSVSSDCSIPRPRRRSAPAPGEAHPITRQRAARARGEMLNIDDVLEILHAATRHHPGKRGGACPTSGLRHHQQPHQCSRRAYIDASRRLLGENPDVTATARDCSPLTRAPRFSTCSGAGAPPRWRGNGSRSVVVRAGSTRPGRPALRPAGGDPVGDLQARHGGTRQRPDPHGSRPSRVDDRDRWRSHSAGLLPRPDRRPTVADTRHCRYARQAPSTGRRAQRLR